MRELEAYDGINVFGVVFGSTKSPNDYSVG